MASAKRVVGTVLFVIALLVTLAFVFLLYAKSVNDRDMPFVDSFSTATLVAGIILGAIAMALFLMLLISRSGERRSQERRLAEEEQRRLAEEERARAFESTLGEPDGLGKGPEMVVYNLASLPPMYRAYDRTNRRRGMAYFTFPRTVQDAIYTSDHVDIGGGMTLKLRTLLAGPKDGTKKELEPRHLKKAEVSIDPKTIPEPLRSRLLGEQAAPDASEAEPALEEPIAAAGRPSGDRSLVSEMEERLSRRSGGRRAAPARAYYGYSGDSHHVEDIEGIGRLYGDKLRAAGVRTTDRLAYEDAKRLSDRVGVPQKTVETWQSMAELVKVSGIGPQYAEALARAGLQGIADLKRLSAATITRRVNDHLDSLETTVVGQKITEKRVEGWQKAAGRMKRIRLKVPEE